MNQLLRTYGFMLVILLFAATGYGQDNKQEEACGTEISPQEKKYLDRTRVARQAFKAADYRGVMTVQIPVQHHIFHTDAGGGGISDADVDDIMDELNDAYAPAGIEFVECDAPYNVNSTQFYYFDIVEENALLAAHEVSGVLNFYYVQDITTTTGSSNICGYSSFPGSRGRDLAIIQNSCADNGSTIIHEVGHYFSLYHTHSGGNELVDGSNCATAGDEICDTEADPNLSGQVNASCIYTGTDTDANGDSYDPPTTNHMSYSQKPCRTDLTDDQIDRVAFSVINDRYYLDCNGCVDYEFNGTFNYGEDFTSHDYTTTGQVSTTNAYDCYSGNPQLRVGNCSSGTGSVKVTFDVYEGTDKLKLLFKTGWSNGSAKVYIDGNVKATLNGTSSCAFQYLYIDNISHLTMDGEVVIEVKDPSSGCAGDIILDRLVVYSDKCFTQNYYAAVPYFTSFEESRLDNYWRTSKSNSNGNIQVTTANGPIHENQHLTFDVKVNGTETINEARLHLNYGGCTNGSLFFEWKEFNDEAHAEDGVYISDDGGHTFAKVLDMTGGAFDTWNPEYLDLDVLAAANGMSLTSTFVVKFQQKDNFSMTSDGIAIDFVLAYGCTTYDVDEGKQDDKIAIAEEMLQRGPVKNLRGGLAPSLSENGGQFTVFPNPASVYTQLEYTLEGDNERVSLAIFNLAGQEVISLVNEQKQAGTHTEEVTVSNLTPGIYLAVLKTNETVITRKFIVE